MAVGDAQKLVAVKIPAPAFFPQIGGLHHGHQQLNRAGAVHFLAHNRFHFAQHAQAHRHPSVKPRGVGFDEPRTEHELMAGKHGFGGGFFEGGNEKLAGFHGSVLCDKTKGADYSKIPCASWG